LIALAPDGSASVEKAARPAAKAMGIGTQVFIADAYAGPPLPNWFLLPATGIFALLSIYFIMNTRGRAAKFLMFACWLRYTLSSLQAFTYHDAVPGLKWVALGSLVIVGAGALMLEKRRFLSPPFYPVAAICVVMLASAIVNGSIIAAIDPIVRFLIFVVIGVGVWQALETNGSTALKRLLLVFIQPLTYQVVSVVLNIPKSGETDGSLSYIGGYYHEELFSLIAATCFFVAIYTGKLGKYTRMAICLAAVTSVWVANYRTTMLGILPLAGVAFFTALPKAFEPSQRAFARLMIIVAGVAVLGVGSVLESDRFSDLADITQVSSLMKPPETYTWADRRVLSSRPYIWSNYVYAYADAPALQKVIGFGPDSWQGKMPNYAHNTLISFLYEMGIVGVIAILFVWGRMFRLALSADDRSRALLIGGHLSFLVLNLATMAHWQVEGNMLYGVLSGYTIAKARQGRVNKIMVKRYGGTQRMVIRRSAPALAAA
jgi:hypothetical protein